MKKEMGEQLSAFVDDELMVREEAMLVGQLCANDQCREVVYRYALMGSAMRSQRGDLLGAELADRIRADVDKETIHDQPLYARAGGLLRPIAGLAVAAGVAAVAIMSLSSTDTGTLTVVDEGTTEIPTIVPAASDALPNTLNAPARLTNYMIQHSEFSPALSRRNVLAEIIGQDIAQDGDQETRNEIDIWQSDESEARESEEEASR